jgi:uncharacterized membrane-anchored protein YhcB (DUF1043 family)
LRKLCNDGLPSTGYFELCALYLLEYEKLLKDNNVRNKTIKQLIMDDEKDKTRRKIKDESKSYSQENRIKNGKVMLCYLD